MRIQFDYSPADSLWHGFNYERYYGLWLSLGIMAIDHYPALSDWTFYFWRFSVSIKRGS